MIQALINEVWKDFLFEREKLNFTLEIDFKLNNFVFDNQEKSGML